MRLKVAKRDEERPEDRPAAKRVAEDDARHVRQAVADPARAPRTALAAVQRVAGNRSVQRLMAGVVSVQRATVFVMRAASDWYKATYASEEASMNDHFNRHPGPWTTVDDYTNRAKSFWASMKDRAVVHTLADGTTGYKVRSSKYFGIYTSTGKIVTFGER